MKIVLVEPGKPSRAAEIDGSLASMQQLVGGAIQAVYPWEDRAALVCNDEGKLIGLPLNRAIEDYDVIAGTFFICGLGEDNFTGLTEQQLERYQKMFECPEKFLRTPEGLICLRCVAGPETAKAHKPKNKDEPER